MKVLMSADTVGGVWTYALELAQALAPHGVDFALATMGKALRDDQRRQLARLSNVTLYESQYKLEWMEDPWVDVARAGDWLLEMAAGFSPDLVHLNGYAHAALPWPVPKLVACHSCVLSWWAAVHGQPAPFPQWRLYKDAVVAGLRSADYIVAPTSAMLRSIRQLYDPMGRPATVIPNARSCSFFAPAKKEPFVFAAGRLWDQAKNISALERVAAELSWPVVIAGPEATPQKNPQTRTSGKCSNCRSIGYLEATELSSWMSRASIYCLPALYEPFGLSVLEAGLSGCVLVLGDIPALRENWQGAAVFVDPCDDKNLSAALRSLIENQSFRERCARRARLRALEFSPTRMAQGYLSVYRSLLAHQAPQSSRMEVPACAS